MQRCVYVELGESFQTNICLQNLASIQPRTSPDTDTGYQLCPYSLFSAQARGPRELAPHVRPVGLAEVLEDRPRRAVLRDGQGRAGKVRADHRDVAGPARRGAGRAAQHAVDADVARRDGLRRPERLVPVPDLRVRTRMKNNE